MDLSPEELERQREELFAAWQDKLDRFAYEPLDASWADDAEGKIADQVAALTDAHADFDYVGTTCKSDHCTTTVRFADFRAAQKGATRLLHQNYNVGCGTEIMLPPPAKRAEPYEATLMHHCWDESPAADE